MRKIKYSSSSATGSDIPFVRFLNEFEAQKGLFSREGIDLDSKKWNIINLVNTIVLLLKQKYLKMKIWPKDHFPVTLCELYKVAIWKF